MRFSAPVKKHWLGSFSIVLPPSGLRGFVPVVRDRWEQGRPGGTGAGGREKGGIPGVGARDPRACIHMPGPDSIYSHGSNFFKIPAQFPYTRVDR